MSLLNHALSWCSAMVYRYVAMTRLSQPWGYSGEDRGGYRAVGQEAMCDGLLWICSCRLDVRW